MEAIFSDAADASTKQTVAFRRVVAMPALDDALALTGGALHHVVGRLCGSLLHRGLHKGRICTGQSRGHVGGSFPKQHQQLGEVWRYVLAN